MVLSVDCLIRHRYCSHQPCSEDTLSFDFNKAELAGAVFITKFSSSLRYFWQERTATHLCHPWTASSPNIKNTIWKATLKCQPIKQGQVSNSSQCRNQTYQTSLSATASTLTTPFESRFLRERPQSQTRAINFSDSAAMKVWPNCEPRAKLWDIWQIFDEKSHQGVGQAGDGVDYWLVLQVVQKDATFARQDGHGWVGWLSFFSAGIVFVSMSVLRWDLNNISLPCYSFTPLQTDRGWSSSSEW